MKQITNHILMIRPVSFRMNEQTAVNNYYQKVLDSLDADTVQAKAQTEFDDFVVKLRDKGIDVTVVEDTLDTDTPDSIFPNNWVSFHENGTVVTYPMFAKNRRLERRPEILEELKNNGFEIKEVLDLTAYENEGKYLEGTGSLLLDRENGKAYCALSPRADRELLEEFCQKMNFKPVVFTAYQTVNDARLPIYHTNVMMCLGTQFSVICLDSIDDINERDFVVNSLEEDGKKVIEISEEQVNHFAGNMLQVADNEYTPYTIMSKSAYMSLNTKQKLQIEEYNEIIYSSLDTIEVCGGGSARCMMAEIFLNKK